MVQRRIDERSQNELKIYNHEVNVLNHAAANEQRMAYQRRANDTARFAAEHMMEERIAAQEEEVRTHGRLQDQNTKLADELQRRKAERIRAEMEVQRICSESEELKQLEQRLKMAYLNRERAAQHEEKQLLKQVENDIDQAITDRMEYERQQAMRTEAEKAVQRKMLAAQQRIALREQMDRKKSFADDAAKEADRDKEMVAAIVKAIENEEEEEYSLHAKKREQMQHAVREAELQRQKDLERRRREQEQEEEDIRRHQERIAAREAQIEQERAQKKAEAEHKLRAVVEHTEKQRNEEEELRLLRDMLWEEELEAKRIQEDAERKRKIEEGKVAMMRANQQQLEQRRVERERKQEEEQRRVEEMFKKFRADEEMEAKAKEAKKIAEHETRKRMDIERLERARMYEQEKVLEMQELQAKREEEEYKKRVVEEARRRLLQQHATALEGYMPKGLLKTKSELEYVRSLAEEQKSRF